MTRINRLIREARESCIWRGHTMTKFTHDYGTGFTVAIRYYADSTCTVCGATVHVESHPAPNSIDISGDAVALDCPVEGIL